MIIPKPKLVVRFLLAALLMTFVIVGCNNEAEKKEDTPTTTPVDTTAASKMDTATTRPVKTTN